MIRNGYHRIGSKVIDFMQRHYRRPHSLGSALRYSSLTSYHVHDQIASILGFLLPYNVNAVAKLAICRRSWRLG
jgi:hypothetical protein